MPLETGTYISDLIPTNPDPTDSETYGANHLQLIKATLKTTFPNVKGAVTAAHAELNALVGAISTGASIQVVTQPTTDDSSNAASTAYVTQKAFASALPGQAGNAGKFVTTDGANVSWAFLPSVDFLMMGQGII
jgi:hypothetical protein